MKLAESLEKGVGAPKNLERAMSLYTQGCDQGSAVSCTDLGTMHSQGEGVEKNEELGVKFLSRGCEAGDAKGVSRRQHGVTAMASASGRTQIEPSPSRTAPARWALPRAASAWRSP